MRVDIVYDMYDCPRGGRGLAPVARAMCTVSDPQPPAAGEPVGSEAAAASRAKLR